MLSLLLTASQCPGLGIHDPELMWEDIQAVELLVLLERIVHSDHCVEASVTFSSSVIAGGSYPCVVRRRSCFRGSTVCWRQHFPAQTKLEAAGIPGKADEAFFKAHGEPLFSSHMQAPQEHGVQVERALHGGKIDTEVGSF